MILSFEQHLHFESSSNFHGVWGYHVGMEPIKSEIFMKLTVLVSYLSYNTG